MTYLASTNSALNFLERREAVNLVLQFVVGVGAAHPGRDGRRDQWRAGA